MVDHQRAGQAFEHRFTLGQCAAIELQLHVPAEGRHAGGHGFEDIPGQGPARQHEKANAARAELGQPIEFCVGHVLIDDDNTACVWSDFGNGFQRTAVVLPVGRRLHDDGAFDAEARAHFPVRRDGRGRRIDLGRRRFGVFGIINVHMRVAGAGRRLELRSESAVDGRHDGGLWADITGAIRVREAADRLRQQCFRQPQHDVGEIDAERDRCEEHHVDRQ